MIKKVDILGIQLDNYTVREAIMCVERYLSNNMLNTIESVSMQMLIDSETDPVLKKVLGSLDLAVIGEKEIIQAAGLGNMQRIKETEENDFYFEFFKRIERNKKSVFLIADTEEKLEAEKKELLETFPKLIFAGEYAVEKCVGDLDAVINDMNATIPDVIVSVLPSPMQEQFLADHREKMNANIWYGIGGTPLHKKKHGVLDHVKSMIHRGKLKNSINHYDGNEEEE